MGDFLLWSSIGLFGYAIVAALIGLVIGGMIRFRDRQVPTHPVVVEAEAILTESDHT